MKLIKINYKNLQGENIFVEHSSPITTNDIIKDLCKEEREQIYAVIINNNMHSLNHTIRRDAKLSFITYRSSFGEKMYENTLKYIFLMSVKFLYKDVRLKISNKIGRDMFFKSSAELDIEMIKSKMQDLINKEIFIERLTVHRKELEEIYKEQGYIFNLDRDPQFDDNYKVYNCEDGEFSYYNYLYGRLLQNTSYIRYFDIVSYKDGILLRMPIKGENSKKQGRTEKTHLFELLDENAYPYEIEYVSDLRQALNIPLASRVIVQNAESFHHTKYDECADKIIKKKAQHVFLAGPSSSGKTTSAIRIAEKLRNKKKKTLILSLDNFFYDEKDSPIINGKKNFDAVTHLDIELFKRTVIDLASGREVKIPKYNFTLNKGQREYLDESVIINEETIVIVEGIHALNPIISEFLNKKTIFFVYVAPIVTLSYDPFTKVSSNMVRLIRRIVRDYHTRSISVEKTFEYWNNVLEGEKENIYPYLKYADCVINTTLDYEMCVLRPFAEEIMREVSEDSPWYYLAKEIFNTIFRFKSLSDNNVPVDSILREFIGESCYKY